MLKIIASAILIGALIATPVQAQQYQTYPEPYDLPPVREYTSRSNDLLPPKAGERPDSTPQNYIPVTVCRYRYAKDKNGNYALDNGFPYRLKFCSKIYMNEKYARYTPEGNPADSTAARRARGGRSR